MTLQSDRSSRVCHKSSDSLLLGDIIKVSGMVGCETGSLAGG